MVIIILRYTIYLMSYLIALNFELWTLEASRSLAKIKKFNIRSKLHRLKSHTVLGVCFHCIYTKWLEWFIIIVFLCPKGRSTCLIGSWFEIVSLHNQHPLTIFFCKCVFSQSFRCWEYIATIFRIKLSDYWVSVTANN